MGSAGGHADRLGLGNPIILSRRLDRLNRRRRRHLRLRHSLGGRSGRTRNGRLSGVSTVGSAGRGRRLRMFTSNNGHDKGLWSRWNLGQSKTDDRPSQEEMKTGRAEEKPAQRTRSGLRSDQQHHGRVNQVGSSADFSMTFLPSERERILSSHTICIAKLSEVGEPFFQRLSHHSRGLRPTDRQAGYAKRSIREMPSSGRRGVLRVSLASRLSSAERL